MALFKSFLQQHIANLIKLMKNLSIQVEQVAQSTQPSIIFLLINRNQLLASIQLFILINQMIQSNSLLNDSPKKQYYAFQSVGSEKVISFSSSQDLEGKVTIQNKIKEDNQSFCILPSNDDFHILCKLNGLYLTVQNDQDGSTLYCSQKSYQPNQKFRIEETEKGSQQYYIYTFCGKVLEAGGHCKKSCTKSVIQKEFDGSDLQKWSLKDFQNLKIEQ